MTDGGSIPFVNGRLSHTIEVNDLWPEVAISGDCIFDDDLIPGRQVREYPIFLGHNVLGCTEFEVVYQIDGACCNGSSTEHGDLHTVVSIAVCLYRQGFISDIYIFGTVPDGMAPTVTVSTSGESYGLGAEFDDVAHAVLLPDPSIFLYDDFPAHPLSDSLMCITHDCARTVDILLGAAVDTVADHCPMTMPVDLPAIVDEVRRTFLNAFRNQAQRPYETGACPPFYPPTLAKYHGFRIVVSVF